MHAHALSCRLDNGGAGTFFEDETPLTEPDKFLSRSKQQQKKLAPGLRSKMIKESAAADPEQANRGVLYAVGVVAVAVVLGGNGIFYNTEPGTVFSPIGADQMREAAEIPGGDKFTAPPTFGTSMGKPNGVN